MYALKYDDMFAECITDAFEPYEIECEIKIAIELPTQTLQEKYGINKYDCDVYMLATLNKKYKNITFLVTECKLGDGQILTLPSNYNFQEQEIIRKVALAKMREEFFKNR